MMPIVHDWEDYPERTVHEYPLPLSEVSGSPDENLLRAMTETVGSTTSEIQASLNERFKTIKSKAVRRFLYIFDGYTPASLMIGKERKWIALKRETLIHERTQNGNIILIPYQRAQLKANSVEGFSFELIPQILEFVNDFAGLSLDIHGDGGVLPLEWLKVATSKDFGGLKKWEGSLPLYLPGNGDVILASRKGKAGRWDHETAPPREAIGPPEINLSEFIPDWLSSCDPNASGVEDLKCGIIEAIDREIRNTFAYFDRSRLKYPDDWK